MLREKSGRGEWFRENSLKGGGGGGGVGGECGGGGGGGGGGVNLISSLCSERMMEG